MRLTKYLLAFFQPHRDVDDRRRGGREHGARRSRSRRRRRRRRRTVVAARAVTRRLGVVREGVVRQAGELEVTRAAVDLARLLEALPDHLLVEPVALLDLEERAQPFGLDHGVAGEGDLADLVARTFGDRNLQLDVARLAVLGILEDLQLRLSDLRLDVAALAVIRLDHVGVFLELAFLVGAVAGDPADPGVAPLVLLHLAGQLAVGDRLVALEVDHADLHLGAFGDVERHVHRLARGADRLDLGLHLDVLVALLGVHVADDPGDLADEALIDERVQRDPQVLLLQLVVDLRLLDLLRSDVVDDLDALPLLHVVEDDLADDAIAEDVVVGFRRQVVEEVGGDQALEVRDDDLVDLLVIRHPFVLGGHADVALHLDVVEVGLGVHGGRSPLLFEARADLEDHRTRSRGWQVRRRSDLVDPPAIRLDTGRPGGRRPLGRGRLGRGRRGRGRLRHGRLGSLGRPRWRSQRRRRKGHGKEKRSKLQHLWRKAGRADPGGGMPRGRQAMILLEFGRPRDAFGLDQTFEKAARRQASRRPS